MKLLPPIVAGVDMAEPNKDKTAYTTYNANGDRVIYVRPMPDDLFEAWQATLQKMYYQACNTEETTFTVIDSKLHNNEKTGGVDNR